MIRVRKRNIKCKMLEAFLRSITLHETNIACENGWLEYYFPFGKPSFQVRTASFREGSRSFEASDCTLLKLKFLIAHYAP